jgi:hypothetical protein
MTTGGSPPYVGPVVRARSLEKHYGRGGGAVRALHDVDLDSAATRDALRLLDRLRTAGQTLVIVTHDSRIAGTADRLVSMRDGVFVEETRLPHGTTPSLGALAGLEG